MYRRVFAFDFDGTIAKNGRVPLPLQNQLERLYRAGFAMFLVTGRQYDTVDLSQIPQVFSGIVWENGAVLQHITSDELYLPFGYVDARLIDRLEQANVPLEKGMAIVSTWTAHEAAVWRALSESGSDAAIVHNKGALMVLPPGAAKGTGLRRLLELCGYSPRNLVSFGDGENDLSLFQISETAIAVADAVSALKTAADLVTVLPGVRGVQQTLETYWLSNNPPPPTSLARASKVLLGKDENDESVYLSGADLCNSNLGIFGDSKSGKSWVTGLLAEGIHVAGYQALLIDPEGDFRGLRSLPGIIALNGDGDELPSAAVVVTLLEEASISVVLDLSAYPVEKRNAYLTELLHRLRPLREHKFRPQWIVLEEAQQFLPPEGNGVSAVIEPMLAQGGWTFVSYRPDRLTESVRSSINHCLLARLSDEEAVEAVNRLVTIPDTTLLAQTPNAHIWLCGKKLVRLRPSGRRVPHVRHLYKYLDAPLPKEKRFYFHTERKYLGIDAANLFEFKEVMAKLPPESVMYHQTRGDFSAWIRRTLGDDILAAHFDKLAHRQELDGDEMREALQQRVASRYRELHAAR